MDDIYLNFFSIFLSLIGGIIATLVMTLMEIPIWKRVGLKGVLEWHENQVLSIKLFRLPKDTIHFKGIFLFHFVNGGLGGLGFLLVLWIFPFTRAEDNTVLIFAILYGIFLWIVTLIPIHKPITGISPLRHPFGITPAVTSLLGHLVYGAILGLYTKIIFF